MYGVLEQLYARGSPFLKCDAILASLSLSRTSRVILKQPLGFKLTVPVCLDSNQASATDPRPPELQPIRRWPECKGVHLDGGADHHADAPLLESLCITIYADCALLTQIDESRCKPLIPMASY